MRMFLAFVFYTIWTVLLVFAIELFVFQYEPGKQINDALECLLKLGETGGGKLTFDWTGIAGTRFGTIKTLWLLGKEETLGSNVRIIECHFKGDRLQQIAHPTRGRLDCD
jgi:hypothetical protein